MEGRSDGGRGGHALATSVARDGGRSRSPPHHLLLLLPASIHIQLPLFRPQRLSQPLRKLPFPHLEALSVEGEGPSECQMLGLRDPSKMFPN